MYVYENISSSTQDVIGHGVVEAGAQLVTKTPIENPNFKFIKEQEDDNKITGVVEQSENAVTEAQIVEPINLEGIN